MFGLPERTEFNLKITKEKFYSHSEGITQKEKDMFVSDVEKKYGVKIEVSEPQSAQSPATSKDSPVAKELASAIKAVHNVKPKFIGIGGGTVAAELRNMGIDAVVWSTMDELAHQPNEYCIIENIAKDAATIAWLAIL